MNAFFHSRPCWSRRDFLHRAGAGFGSVALASLIGRAQGAPPLGFPIPHFPAKAKNVIFLFMYGGPSQIDTFDYKPLFTELHGKPVPASFKKNDKVGGVFTGCKDELMAGPWKWKRHGQ